MKFATLDDWLNWQEGLNPRGIDLGLERVRAVWQRLAPKDFPACPVISIAGTNGKGSSLAFLEAILNGAGYSTLSYSSPHLLRYNERIRIDGRPATDAAIMRTFQAIDQARGDVPLTYFEFGTLAALQLAVETRPDALLLEVGLGGRLDAVNIVDADVALITTIGLDHQDWLGDDLEQIAVEKAGIMRAGRPVVFSAGQRPASIDHEARRQGAQLYARGRDFAVELGEGGWSWRGWNRQLAGLPWPALTGVHQIDNAAGVIAVVELLAQRLPVSRAALEQGVREASLAGRAQRIEQSGKTWLLDVAHNPQAARVLAQQLDEPVQAVCAMLCDKDAAEVYRTLAPMVECWHLAGLELPRGCSARALRQQMQMSENNVHLHDDVGSAMSAAARAPGPVLVFGSFHTVSQALIWLNRRQL